MMIEKKLLPKNQWVTDLDRPTQEPDGIVIHWIGPYPTQTVYDVYKWWETDPNYHSAHFVVKGKKVLQTMEETDVAYHAGDARNYHYIGIEVIPDTKAGDFAEDTIETLAELCADIRTRRTIKKVERHYDGKQKKDCPRWYCPQTGGDERWQELRGRLA